MLRVFTYGAGDINRFKNLRDSSSLCGLKINYITQPVWNGFYDKTKHILNIIKDLQDDTVICVIDGYDMLAMAPEEEILDKFFSKKCDILFGAELNCWPGEFLERYDRSEQSTNYRFINGGGYIGYKKAVYSLLTWKSDSEKQIIYKAVTDQGYFKEYYFANRDSGLLKLDIGQEIFQNMFSVDWAEMEIVNGRVKNSVLGTNPCFVHFSGDSWKIKGGRDIMPIIVELCSRGVDSIIPETQNFNSAYFKRAQIK